MTIATNSRYASSKTLTVTAPAAFGGNNISVIVPGIQQPYSFKFFSYQVVDGDRIDNLAQQFYGDPTHWWRIADANIEMLWYDNLVPGTILRIPTTR